MSDKISVICVESIHLLEVCLLHPSRFFSLALNLITESVVLLDELLLAPLVRLALGIVSCSKLSCFDLEVVAGCLRLRDHLPVLLHIILEVALIHKLQVQ